MRRDLQNRLEQVNLARSRPCSEMTDAELDALIRRSIELEGGTAAAAAKHRAAGHERQARFVELYMAGDRAWENYVDTGEGR